MNELSALKNLKSLKKDMENMTYKEKLVHIWTYYKWVLIVVLILIIAVSILLACLENASKRTLLGGISINVTLDDEGKALLTDGYLEIIGTGHKKEEIVLSNTILEEYDKASDIQGNYYSMMNVASLCANSELDYMIMDQAGLKVMAQQGVFAALDEYYSPAELDAFTAAGISLEAIQNQGEEAPTLAVMDITNCAFMQKYANTKDKVYFVFAVNSPNKDTCREFLNYILNWKPE